MSFNILFLFGCSGRRLPFRVNDRALAAGLEADTALPAEIGVDIEAFFNFPFNRGFRALFGAGAAPDAIVADTVGHGVI